MSFKRLLLMLGFMFLLSGCSVTYNLDISNKGFNESFDVFSDNDEKIQEYAISAFTGILGYEDVDTNYFEKKDGYKYYNTNTYTKDGKVIVNYNYQFDEKTILESNVINSAYNTIIFKRYDHDFDGKVDYMMVSTDDRFRIFQLLSKLNEVTVNITCHYKIISSNADEVNGNILTWHITKNDLKAINMVYDPDRYVDDRTLWEKIKDGDFTNTFTIFLVVFVVGGIIIFLFKKKGDRRNKV